MATDQFGNILSPEEEERLRQHQMRMGVMPAALPPTAPFGGGIGVSNYKGNYGPYVAPTPFTPEPTVPNEPFSMGQLASSITPTWDTGAVSNVSQFAGPTVNKFTPTGSDYTPQQLGTPIDELQQQNIPDNVVPLDLAFGAFGAQHVPALPVNPSSTMNFQDFLDKVGPVQSGTRDAYYMPDGTVRNAAGDLVSTDPTGGAIDQDMSTVLSNANMDNLYAQTDFTPPVTDQDYINEGTIPPGDELDYTRFLDKQYGGPDLSAVSTVPQMADTSSSLGRVAKDYLSRLGITDSPYQDAIDETGDPVMQDLLSHFDLSNVPGGRTANTVREVLEDKDESLADYIRDVQIDKYKQDNPNATIDDVVAVITSGNKDKTFMMESDTAFAEKISKAKKSDEIMIAKARQKKAAADKRAVDLEKQQQAAARRQEAARQAAAQAEANAAIERVAQANALMNSKAYQESGLDGLSAAQRDIVAAANVDTFAGMGFGRGFMGADIGREDGGGFTGGDFSGGAGWE